MILDVERVMMDRGKWRYHRGIECGGSFSVCCNQYNDNDLVGSG